MALRIFAAFAIWATTLSQAIPMGYSCNSKPVDYLQDITDSDFAFFGRLEEAPEVSPENTTNFRITHVFKAPLGKEGLEVIQIHRKLPVPTGKNPPSFLLCGDIRDGRYKPELCIQGTDALADYVKGLMKVKVTDRVKRLQFCFDYLQHDQAAISTDAYSTFKEATDSDLRQAANQYQPEKLRKWLNDEKSELSRHRLYAFLLAFCGNDNDAGLLRKLLDRSEGCEYGTEKVLVGYTILDPKVGWAYVREIIKKQTNGFAHRYHGLLAVRHLKDQHRGLIPDKELIAAMADLVAQPDMADLPINELRRWKSWNLNDQIFDLIEAEGFQKKFIRRAILRYALQCPDTRAEKYVARRRLFDPDDVAENEKWLEDEAKQK